MIPNVTRALPAEEAACFALLPDSRGADIALMIARMDGHVAGAAAIHWRGEHAPAGFPLDIQVMPAWRRKGVGRALVAAATGLVAGETDALWSLLPLSVDTPEATFLTRCGFVAGEHVFRYRIDTAKLCAQSERIVERLRRHGRIPATARAVSLGEVPLDAVATLAAQTLGHAPAAMLAMLRTRVDLTLSVAVMEGDELGGAIFGDWRSGECRIEANVVAPAFRNGYVNALLLAQSTRNILEAGWDSFTFGAREGAADTMNLAKRAGGERAATRAFYRHAVARA